MIGRRLKKSVPQDGNAKLLVARLKKGQGCCHQRHIRGWMKPLVIHANTAALVVGHLLSFGAVEKVFVW